MQLTGPATDGLDGWALTSGSTTLDRLRAEDLCALPQRRLASLLLEAALRDRALFARLREEVRQPHLPSPAPALPVAANDPAPPSEGFMVGSSPAMLDVFARIRRYAPSDAPVLITGESGSGKELAARAIHERSGRAGGPFIAVNCAALPAALIASELFGHEKGAFTGAVARRIGFVEQAHKGTLFLDEIGDLPMELQGYLLRFLQDSMITRIGGTETVRVDVRILSATNVPLDGAIRKREFREDLFYRLAVLTLRMPALRERGDDVELLATYLLREVARDLRREVEGFTPAALSAIRAHPWPGNVRELISVVRRAVVMADGALIDADRLGLDERRGAAEPAVAAPSRPRAGSPEEGVVLRAALARCSGNVSIAARSLGVSRMTLYRMLKRHGLAPDTSPT